MKDVKILKVYFRILKNYFRVTPGTAVVSVAYYLIQGLFPAFTALVLSSLFDEAYAVTTGTGGDRLIFFGVLYLAVYILNSFWIFIAEIVMETGADKGNVHYRFEICKKLAKLPLIEFENVEIKDKHRRAEECLYTGMMTRSVRYSLGIVLTGLINLISVSAVLARYSLWFLPLCVLSVIPYCVARIIRGAEFYRIKQRQARKQRRLQYLWSLFTDRRTAKELRVFGADDYVLEQWTKTRDEIQAELWVQEKKEAVSVMFCDALRIVGYGVCIALTLVLTLRGTVSVGVFGACIAAFMSLQNATRSVLELGGHLPSLLAFVGDYFSFIDLPEESPDGETYTGLQDEIKLDGVGFRYPNREDFAVHDVSLTLRRGEKIVILGENGSGKTTLIKLLLGMFPPDEGQILYDGSNVDTFSRASHLNTVSAVAQDFVRYNLTLRENVAMSDTSHLDDDSAIADALRAVGLDDLLKSPGLDGELGSSFGGGDISGGQWQKLAIARGLFRDSELIVLDEPTSALDPLIETEILEKFLKAAQDKTAVIISHRVGLCRMVDKIAVMKNGQLVEVGSHADLLALGGEYTRLFRAQEKWYKDKLNTDKL